MPAAACDISFPLLVMGILLAYFYRAALWKRILLVLSTIPLTIVTNSLRIALTGIIYKHWGAAAAEGFFHGFSGWLIFMFTFGVLLAEIWVLQANRCPAHRRASSQSPRQSGLVAEPGFTKGQPIRGLKAFFAPPQFVVAAVLLVADSGHLQGVEFREKIPAKQTIQPVSA